MKKGTIENTENSISLYFIVNPFSENPGQNVLGHLRELGTKTHFAKLTRILPLKKAWRCCYKGLFVLSPSPPSSVDCVELKLECITPTLHRGGRGEGRCLNLTSYCVSVPRVLTKVVPKHIAWLKKNGLETIFRLSYLARGSRRRFATPPPPVFPPNDFWESSAEIPYW